MASLFRLIDNPDLLVASAVGTVGDPDGTRTITSIVVLLIALGLGLVLLAIWMWRSTRPDPELLAPLEAMGDRKWRRRDPVWQRRRLDELRPEGAQPLVASAAPPEVDESFDAGPSVSGFDDLNGERIETVPTSAPPPSSGDDPDPVPPSPAVKPSGSWTPPQLRRLGGEAADVEQELRELGADADVELVRGEQPTPD